MSKKRLYDINRATGMAIALVVLGHIVAVDSDFLIEGVSWFKPIKKTIYSFHMPFFMFLSGYIMYYSYKPITSVVKYGTFIKKKFIRLLVPLLVFGLIVFFGKFFGALFLKVDNPVNSYYDLIKILIIPKKSISGSLWYLYVLFELYLLFPILLYVFKGKIEFILIIGALIYFLYAPMYFSLNLICEYLFVFTLGGVASKYSEKYIMIIDKFCWLFNLLFIIALIVYQYHRLPNILMGLLSIPALHSLVRTSLFEKFTFLDVFGKHTLAIYLMNTIIIGLSKGIMLKFTSITYNEFYIMAPILFVLGLYVPILLKEYIFKKVPIIYNIIK